MAEVTATLANLADPARRDTVERYEGRDGGGIGPVERASVSLADAACTWDEGRLDLIASASGAAVEATPGALDLPADWQPYGRLVLEATCEGDPVRLGLAVVGARSLLADERDLASGEAVALALDLGDLPLTAGVRPAYEPSAVRITLVWQGGDTTRRVALRRVALEPRDGPPRPCVDRFGQRLAAAWPGKVADEADLRADAEAEAAELASYQPLPDRNAYGGWLGGPAFEATGFFRVDRDPGGRWWLVDPDGRPFWSHGTTGVRTTYEATPIDGREALFQALPERDGLAAEAWSDRGVSFHCWNVLRKYGARAAWRDRVLARYPAWGLNTIANTSEEIVLGQDRVPYTRKARGRGEGAPLAGRRFPDVFDPAWARWLDAHFAEEVAPYRDERWLVGFFVDNESPWGRMRLLDAPAETALKAAWVEMLRERFAEAAKAGAALGVELGSWDAARRLTEGDVAAGGPPRDLVRAFETRYAERYFETIARLLKRHAPKHLYLGCRFVQNPPHEGIIRAARHADVVSVNCYSLYPDQARFDHWHEHCERPIVIGEHHLALRSPQVLPPLYKAFTAGERRRYYVKYLRELARMPYAVGAHWFQWADQPPTGRAGDGENQAIGFVSITDRPHRHLVEAAREVGARMYHWHAAAQAAKEA